MNKKLLALGIASAGALITEFAVHGYLDVMYKETIPQSIAKRLTLAKGTTGMDKFRVYTEKSCEWINEQDIENIDLTNNRGYTLKGYFLPAKEKSKKFVLFAHGYRSDHMGDPANFERYYHEKGYNFMSVDHTAAGDSQGDFVGFDYHESNDMLSWVNYLITRFGEDISIVLHGVSMGGATVCQMASRVPSQVKLIISDCAYTSAEDIFTYVASSAGVKHITSAVLKLFNGLNKALAKFDLAETDVRESVKNAKAPMLFVHGKIDDFVPVEMGYELYDICTSDKELFIVDDAYHAQSIMVANEEYKAKIDKWLERCVEA